MEINNKYLLCFIWILMTSLRSDGYQEWKQPVRRGRMLTAGLCRFGTSCCSCCWVLLISQCLLQCSIFPKGKWGGEASKYLPWGRKAPGFPYLLNVLLTHWLFGVPCILPSPSSFLLSYLSRNGSWVIEQLMNTKFQLSIKIFLHLLGQHSPHSSFGPSNFQYVPGLQIQDFHLMLWHFPLIFTPLFGNICIHHSKCSLISSVVILLLFP